MNNTLRALDTSGLDLVSLLRGDANEPHDRRAVLSHTAGLNRFGIYDIFSKASDFSFSIRISTLTYLCYSTLLMIDTLRFRTR